MSNLFPALRQTKFNSLIYTLYVAVLSLTLFTQICTAENIILFGSSFYASHLVQLLSIGHELRHIGHNVYVAKSEKNRIDAHHSNVITPIEFKPKRDDSVPGNIEKWVVEMSLAHNDEAIAHALSKLAMLECEGMLDDEQFINRLQQLKLDLAVVDRFEIAPCYYIIPYKLGIKYVSVSAYYQPQYSILPSFAPVSIFPTDSHMTFFQRTVNLAFNFLFALMTSNINDTLIKKYAPNISSYNALRDASLISFVTSEHILYWPRPVMPNIILIPPPSMAPATRLPKNFEIIANEAFSDGLIVISFGSMGDYLPEDIIKKIIATLGKIKQKVIFRLSDKLSNTIGNVTENVHIFPWIPQNDLLGHENTKLFITHCGSNGIYEAIYHGIPVIGFPLFGDQKYVAFIIEQRGFGIQLNIRQFTQQQLMNAIDIVLANHSLADNVRKASNIIQDSPMRPRQVIAYWLQHIFKYGHLHLQSKSQDLEWYKLLMCDTILFSAIILVVVIALSVRALKFAFWLILKLL